MIALQEKQSKEKEEMKECTFRPAISKRPKKSALKSIAGPLSASTSRQKLAQSSHYLEQVIENNVPKTMPKGYAKMVTRLRKQQEEK